MEYIQFHFGYYLKLGLGEIFGTSANFSGMLEGNEPLAVSKVIQKAFIEVNEEGAEAAAATGKCHFIYFQKLKYY